MQITCDKLVIRYDAFSLTADFTIPTGSRIAILGPSGGGKSTLLSTLAGFKEVEQGQIIFGEMDVTNAPPSERPLSILFQEHNLFPHLTVAQNIGLGLRPNLKLTQEDHQSVQNVIEATGLKGKADTLPKNLSGGQQQRAALARAMLRDKPILCLDEPFAALGPALRQDMLALLGEVLDRSNATALMVTHNPSDALAFAEKTILVADGVAHKPKPTKALLSNPPKALRDYLG